MEAQYNVRAVDRALAILDCFTKNEGKHTLAQLAKAVGLPTTTTLRLLSTMEQSGYVIKDSITGLYSLGWKLAKLGNTAFAGLDVCSLSYPFLEELHSLHNESFGLYIAQGAMRVCAARIDSTNTFRQSVALGSTRSIETGASGHVLLAYATDPVSLEVARKSSRCTPDFLQTVREQGYSISHGEHVPGTVSIAAPVFDHNGVIAAALFVTGPAVRIEPMLGEYIKLIPAFAAKISMQMGYEEKKQ